jgi:hypothetical protein
VHDNFFKRSRITSPKGAYTLPTLEYCYWDWLQTRAFGFRDKRLTKNDVGLDNYEVYVIHNVPNARIMSLGLFLKKPGDKWVGCNGIFSPSSAGNFYIKTNVI